MEACGGAHHWARAIGRLGHQVRLATGRRLIRCRRLRGTDT
jgi:transposase